MNYIVTGIWPSGHRHHGKRLEVAAHRFTSARQAHAFARASAWSSQGIDRVEVHRDGRLMATYRPDTSNASKIITSRAP